VSAATAKQTPAGADRYLAAFEARWRSADELTTLRRTALEAFLATGFPTQRDEEWKYTNLRRLESRNFVLAEGSAAIDAQSNDWIAHGGARIVLADGRWSPALSSNSVHPPGVTVLSLGQWLRRDPSAVAARLSEQQPARSSAFEQLNLAFFEDGLVIELSEGAHTDEPIYVVHQWSPQASGRMNHPRILVRAGRNSRCTLIEHYLGPPDIEYLTNAVTLIDLDEGAGVHHYRLQQESTRSFHIGCAGVRQRSDSRYALHDIALGASLGRMNVTTLLEGPGAHVALHGLFAPAGTQHLDVHTRIDHVAPCTTSEEDYRGVADGRGRGVFNGKVLVRPDAQKIDAHQSSRNLLLSPTAEIDTKPELEIYANDVKCSHGATTGRLDAAALFYLRSRGLSESDARALLIRAFAESILTSVTHAPLRTYLEQHLEARFSISSESQP
jgi:Fe-S cluster assembly protein SufD